MYRRLTSTMPHRNHGKTGCDIDVPTSLWDTERRWCFVIVENGEFTTVTFTQGKDMGRVVLHLFRNLNAYMYKLCLQSICGTLILAINQLNAQNLLL
jgi:hypothetical protein